MCQQYFKEIKKIRYATIYVIVGIFLAGIFLPFSVHAEQYADKCRSDQGEPYRGFGGVIPDFNQMCSSFCASKTSPSALLWSMRDEDLCCCEDPSPIICPPGKKCLTNPLGISKSAVNVPHLIGNILKGLFGVIGTIALGVFIYGGFLWMTAFGEEGKIKKGWDTMIWAGMGLAVMFGSYIAVDFILKALLGS